MTKLKTVDEIQEEIDNIYGEGVWTLLTYEGGQKPSLLKHKCGETKTIKQAKNIKSGKILCSCDPHPKPLQELYERNKVKKDALQKEIDSIYGEGSWKIDKFNGMSNPLTLKHSCGEDKTLSRAITIRRGTCTCKCELLKSNKRK